MPRLNLKEERAETQPVAPEPGRGEAPPPTLREIGGPRRGLSPWLQVALAILLFALIAVGLNYFGVIRLWEGKPPAVVETMEEPEVTQPQEEPLVEVTPTPTPVPVEKPPVVVPPAGAGGDYTVQVSSWMTQGKASEEAAKLTAGGFNAFVEEAVVQGETWHRVRIGHYATQKEAATAASQLEQMLEDGFWVTRVRSK
jgi:hypothetical protein